MNNSNIFHTKNYEELYKKLNFVAGHYPQILPKP